MRRPLLVLASLASFAAAACGSDGPTGTGSIEGTYTLRSVNGGTLPATLSQVGDDQLQIVSDRYEILEGGAYTNLAIFRVIEGGTPTDESLADAGDWELSGTTLTFFSDDGETVYEAQFSGGNTLTMSGFVGTTSFTLIYRK